MRDSYGNPYGDVVFTAPGRYTGQQIRKRGKGPDRQTGRK